MEVLSVALAAAALSLPSLETVTAKSFYAQPEIVFTLSEVPRSGLTVVIDEESDGARLSLSPCRLPEQMPAQQNFETPGVQVERLSDSPRRTCQLRVHGGNYLDGVRHEISGRDVRLYLFADGALLRQFDVLAQWHALAARQALQPDLRRLAVAMAGFEQSAYVQDQLQAIFRQGSFSEVLAASYGVCSQFRFEYGQTLQDLKLLEQFTGTPETFWLQKCLKRLDALQALERDPGAGGVLRGAFWSAIVQRPNRAGELVAKIIEKQLAGLSPDSVDARGLHFLLARRAARLEQWEAALQHLDAALFGDQSFSVHVQTFSGLSPAQEEVQVTLRLNRVNLLFWKAEILRDARKDHRAAAAIYEKLAALEPGEMYVSIHPTENAFGKPAAIAARSELALTHLKSGSPLKACGLWADLAWQFPDAKMEGSEDQQHYCEDSLLRVERYCGGLWAPGVVSARLQRFAALRPECRELAERISGKK